MLVEELSFLDYVISYGQGCQSIQVISILTMCYIYLFSYSFKDNISNYFTYCIQVIYKCFITQKNNLYVLYLLIFIFFLYLYKERMPCILKGFHLYITSVIKSFLFSLPWMQPYSKVNHVNSVCSFSSFFLSPVQLCVRHYVQVVAPVLICSSSLP